MYKEMSKLGSIPSGKYDEVESQPNSETTSYEKGKLS